MLPTVESRGAPYAAHPSGYQAQQQLQHDGLVKQPHSIGSGAWSRVGKRRKGSGWDTAVLPACSLLLVLGGALVGVSSKLLAGTTKTHGQLVGGLCCLLGVVGWASLGLPLPCSSSTLGLALSTSTSSSTNGKAGGGRLGGLAGQLGLPLRTALLVGLVLAGLGTVQLLDQASTDVGTHCMMAEAAVRIAHLEESVTKLKHDELLTQVFFRLNEMDDLLAATAEGNTAHVELKGQMLHLQHKDRELIRDRVDRLQRHAHALLARMQAQQAVARAERETLERNITAVQKNSSHAVSYKEYDDARLRQRQLEADRKQREEDLWLLEKRAEAVQSVVHYIEARSHDAHSGLTFDEYEIILHALLEGSTVTDPSGTVSVPHPPHTSSGATAGTAAGGGAGTSAAGGVSGMAAPPGVFPGAGPAQDASKAAALTSSPVAVLAQALTKDKEDMGTLQAAFERRAAGSSGYEQSAQSDPRLHLPQHVQHKREAARKEFEARFFSVFQAGAGHLHPDTFRNSLVSALNSLPEHCLRDEQALRWLRWLCLGLAAAQAVAAHIITTSLAGKALLAKDA